MEASGSSLRRLDLVEREDVAGLHVVLEPDDLLDEIVVDRDVVVGPIKLSNLVLVLSLLCQQSVKLSILLLT